MSSFPPQKAGERGATPWAFIVTLLLFFVVCYLYWSKTQEVDEAFDARDQAQARLEAVTTDAAALAVWAEEISRSIGWVTESLPTTGFGPTGRQNITVANKDMLAAHVTPDAMLPGTADGQEPVPGTATVLQKQASIVITREARVHDKKIGDEKTYEYATLPKEFQDKLDGYMSEWRDKIGPSPVPPSDPDDVEGTQAYNADLENWRQLVKERDEALMALASDDAWKEYSQVVRSAGEWGEAKPEAVEVHYYSYPEGGANSVESLIEPLPQMLQNYREEVTEVVTALSGQIRQAQADSKAKTEELNNAQTQLAAEQQRYTDDMTTKASEIEDLDRRVTQAQNDAAAASQSLAETKEELTTNLKKTSGERDALQQAVNTYKERRDHEIRRDEPKGNVLAVSQTLGTGTIDRGSADRVYAGMKLVVSALDRGGNRFDKGEVIVTNVTGRHSAKFRITRQAAPIVGGDRIHNPLWDPTGQIHVYIHGKLDKWSRELAVARLKDLDVVVQNAMNGKTDYVIIPNSLSVKPSTPSGDEEDEGDEEDAGGAANPLAEVEALARRFGAVVLTERLFDVFLDY